ncbi:MAG: NAD-glutamate dehydrogenase [Gemmatimonadota bacterium]|nr:NAD-glutamate dehydrogenase [Gemmatimonadota bacterium]
MESVCDHVRGLVPEEEADLAVDFARAFLERAPEELLRGRSGEDVAGMTLGAYRFLAASSPDRVDVGTPTVEQEGWDAGTTVIRTNVSERPFIIDTIREFLHAEDLPVAWMVYPILDVSRDAEGRVTAVAPPSDTGNKESLVHLEIDRVTDPGRLEHIRGELRRRLQDVVRATDDFEPMIGALDRVVADLERHRDAVEERSSELAEIRDFLKWLRDDGFVFLGYRAYDFVPREDGDRVVIVEPGSGLGVLRNEAESRFAAGVPLSELDEGMRRLAERGPVLIISKTNAESTVHRRARMDYIGIKKLDEEGRSVGEHRFVGLFTSRTFSEAAENIPILRQKLADILEAEHVRPGSHDYKEIITIFNSMPKEELFLTSAEEIGADVRTVLTAYNTDDVRVALREDPLERGLSVMVILPKDRFSGAVRKEIEAALVRIFDGDVLNYHLALGSGDQARLHFHMGTRAEVGREAHAKELEQVVGRLIRTWEDRIHEGLAGRWSSDDARRLARDYARTMSREYQAVIDPAVAVSDIETLEAMKADGRTTSIAFANREGPVAGAEGVTELKVFLRGERLVLSDFMPVLEDAGLTVLGVKPFDVEDDGVPEATIYLFAVLDASGGRLDVDRCGELLSETILAVRSGDALSDRLNALVVTAGLRWREVDALRAYAGFAFQVGAVPSRLALPSALVAHPGIARELFELFETRFDPSRSLGVEERDRAVADIRAAFQASLRGVALLSADRALRRLAELISATVRTNYYRTGGARPEARSGGAPYVSFKFDSNELDFGRRTSLLYEVWVHSARMEGVHLRGARVARGGIRWSDRPDDFRIEVLGLVRTQVVKNAVIVPGGSKGGFITRRVPSEPDARMEEGRRQYRTLIRGLLDITDNYVQGDTVTPEGIVAYDPPDPYLVVAADKGTATFSDIANAVAAEYGFWLDDAFASGGSHGYDHKMVGITARGAWECVRRHFREKGKDVQTEPFTVAGIGDMSGDVFGNGMLLSEQIRLVAAFDHRHVFIDPDPDPATSFAERKRVFELGRSSWEDYDTDLLSPGGMVVPRGAKEVELTPEARRALGLSDDEPGVMDGETLIRCVLRAPVELLWNGGIGTYVKADSETHADAGDPANDSVRIDASELRCEVVGEGGNLGFTQAARVEYALRGGRINTDALDNSGGVDMSDHEVNLKILLQPTVAEGRMSVDERNELLEELTESIAHLVLEDNRSQSLAVSLDEQRVRESFDDFRDLMFALEKTGELDRAGEGLPSLDVLGERREGGRTLVRPELCVLLSYAKLALKTRLLAGGLPDDPVTESYLLGYFPSAAIAAAGRERLEGHRLRREIIASQLTNDLVDVMGATFITRVARDTGSRVEEVARAWLVASRLADHRALVAQIAEQQDRINTRAAYRWILGLQRVLERTTRWVLQNVEPETSPATVVAESVPGLAVLRDNFGSFVTGEERTLFEARVEEIRKVGADEVFSRRLITLRFLDQLLEVLDIARDTESDPVATAHAYYRTSELFEIPWLRRSAFASVGDDQWEHRAAQALSEDLSRAHRKLVVHVLGRTGSTDDVSVAIDRLLRTRAREIERFRGVVADLKAESAVGFAAVSVVARELAALADRRA